MDVFASRFLMMMMMMMFNIKLLRTAVVADRHVFARTNLYIYNNIIIQM